VEGFSGRNTNNAAGSEPRHVDADTAANMSAASESGESGTIVRHTPLVNRVHEVHAELIHGLGLHNVFTVRQTGGDTVGGLATRTVNRTTSSESGDGDTANLRTSTELRHDGIHRADDTPVNNRVYEVADWRLELRA